MKTLCGKFEDKVDPMHDTKSCGRSGDTAPRILNFDTSEGQCSAVQNYQRDALNIIYSSNIITLLYMFRVSSTHLQEDIVVHKQCMVPSLCKR